MAPSTRPRALIHALAGLLALSLPLAALADEAPRVLRSTFTTSITDREPADQIDTVTGDLRRVYYFLEVAGLSGRELTVQWEHEGEPVAEVQLPVDASPWRTWSSKRLSPEVKGLWRVVVSVDDQVLSAEELVQSEQLPRWPQ
ncbi:DUF2914 domain-containing protein [Ectothiorhodospiraceae bacterium 2226]|nr:DUF2914 domain-containing protein [Ectothiorhodospiraceae bacterium 2226]